MSDENTICASVEPGLAFLDSRSVQTIDGLKVFSGPVSFRNTKVTVNNSEQTTIRSDVKVAVTAPSIVLNGNVNVKNFRISSVQDGVNPKDAVNMGQVNAIKTSLSTQINELDTAVNVRITDAMNEVVDGAPSVLNTLREVADAIANDAGFSTTMISKVDSESVRAQAVEGALSGAIASESIRAQDAEDALSGALASLQQQQYSINADLDMNQWNVINMADGYSPGHAVTMRQALLLDGSQGMNDNLKMHNHRVTMLGRSNADDDAVRRDEVVLLDGSKQLQGNLQMGSNRITGLARSVVDDDAVRRDEMLNMFQITPYQKVDDIRFNFALTNDSPEIMKLNISDGGPLMMPQNLTQGKVFTFFNCNPNSLVIRSTLLNAFGYYGNFIRLYFNQSITMVAYGRGYFDVLSRSGPFNTEGGTVRKTWLLNQQTSGTGVAIISPGSEVIWKEFSVIDVPVTNDYDNLYHNIMLSVTIDVPYVMNNSSATSVVNVTIYDATDPSQTQVITRKTHGLNSSTATTSPIFPLTGVWSPTTKLDAPCRTIRVTIQTFNGYMKMCAYSHDAQQVPPYSLLSEDVNDYYSVRVEAVNRF